MSMPASQSAGQRRDGSNAVARRRDPVRQMEDMHQTMGALLQDFFGGDTAAAFTGWSAPADIEETSDAYVVELDLPGVKPEDVDVELRDNLLRVCGELKERERSGILRRRSRRVGRFEHAIALPGEVNPTKVDAKLSSGVLTVRVARAVTSQPRRIEVKGS
jgi:HSP20 family protein